MSFYLCFKICFVVFMGAVGTAGLFVFEHFHSLLIDTVPSVDYPLRRWLTMKYIGLISFITGIGSAVIFVAYTI